MIKLLLLVYFVDKNIIMICDFVYVVIYIIGFILLKKFEVYQIIFWRFKIYVDDEIYFMICQVIIVVNII